MKHREEHATCKVCRCATTAQSGFQPSIPSLNGSNPGSSTDPWLQWGPLARARVVRADSAAPSTRNSLPSLLSVTCLLHPPPEHLLPHVDSLCCGHTMLWTHYAVSCGHTMLFHVDTLCCFIQGIHWHTLWYTHCHSHSHTLRQSLCTPTVTHTGTHTGIPAGTHTLRQSLCRTHYHTHWHTTTRPHMTTASVTGRERVVEYATHSTTHCSVTQCHSLSATLCHTLRHSATHCATLCHTVRHTVPHTVRHSATLCHTHFTTVLP